MRLLPLLLAALGVQQVLAADCAREAKVATHFMNGYVQHLIDRSGDRAAPSVSGWIRESKAVTRSFKLGHQRLEEEGRKSDPDLGWGDDLILDAQDFPAQGFRFSACKGAGLVELRGVDWEAFVLVVKVIELDGQHLVEGAGRVNVSVSERARR